MIEDIEPKKLDSKGPSKDKAAGRGKRGCLSAAEMDFIKENSETMDVATISKHIGKSADTIRKYAYKENLQIREKGENTRFYKIRRLLRSRQYWKDIQKQFSPEEIKVFENTWISLYMQFDEDVMPMEELQMNKHITLIILRNRYLQKMFNFEKRALIMQKLLEEEYSKSVEARDLSEIQKLENILDKCQLNQLELNKQINTLLDKQKETEKQLKISRDQRIKGVLDSTQNWTSVLRLLNDSVEIRDQVGRHIEIMRAAQENEKFRLFLYHQFIDKSTDRIVLNQESVDFELEEEDNTNE